MTLKKKGRFRETLEGCGGCLWDAMVYFVFVWTFSYVLVFSANFCHGSDDAGSDDQREYPDRYDDFWE